MGGRDCDQPLFASCAKLVGMRGALASPCVYDRLAHGVAPISCDCLMECEAIGMMGVRECYVTDAANATVMAWARGQRSQRGLEANAAYYAAAIRGADEESARECSGHGVYAPAMPAAGPPRAGAHKSCMCYGGWGGRRCEDDTSARPTHMCLNGCSGRGRCVRNWCHCDRGTWGVDCSKGANATTAYTPIGAQTGKWAAGAPRIYVYELPPRFNAWLHAGEAGWWQDFDLWGEDVVIHRRALHSAYRVNDPADADLFLVPVWVSKGMWQMNWGFRDLLVTGVRVVSDALAYIEDTYPYFARKGGADHIWVFGHDQGAWRIRAKIPRIAKGIFLTPFGAGPAQRGGHAMGQDIVVPPVLYSHVPAGLLNHAGRRMPAVPDLAFFQGKMNLHIPYEYSMGIRQGLYKAFRSSGRILVREGHELNKEKYFEHMSSAKFCVAAAGFGFSTRPYEAATSGCIPLIMMDGMEMAFAELLPWGLFSLRVNDSLRSLTTLDGMLDAVSEEALSSMRSYLYCVWPRLLWLRHDHVEINQPLPRAEGLLKYDAFESLAWTLRRRLRGDIGWPPDWDEGCQAVETYFTKPSDGRKWAPWRNWKGKFSPAMPRRVLEHGA